MTQNFKNTLRPILAACAILTLSACAGPMAEHNMQGGKPMASCCCQGMKKGCPTMQGKAKMEGCCCNKGAAADHKLHKAK